MIHNLGIENFKSWRDTGDIRMAPITVFCGSNSSGKSSLIQLLLILKQTVESDDRRTVLNFGDRDTLVDLGGFADTIYKHDITNEIRYSIKFNTYIKQLSDITEGYEPFNKIDFTAKIGYDENLGMIALNELNYKLLSNNKSGYYSESNGNIYFG